METLYIIGKDRPFAPGVRISSNPAIDAGERIWAVLTAERAAPFIEGIDTDARCEKESPGKYGTSPHILVHHLISAATFGGGDGADLSLEVRDLDLPNSTLTIIRRAKPTL